MSAGGAGAGGSDPGPGAGSGAGPGLLDPAGAAAAGAAHGQLASGLPGGGLVLSAHKLVEEGARALVLLAPRLFRLDVRPDEDSLHIATRSLHAAGGAWAAEENPMSAYGDRAAAAEVPLRMTWRYELPGPDPIVGRVQLLVTVDRVAGRRHVAAHAVLRPAAAPADRGRSRPAS